MIKALHLRRGGSGFAIGTLRVTGVALRSWKDERVLSLRLESIVGALGSLKLKRSLLSEQHSMNFGQLIFLTRLIWMLATPAFGTPGAPL